MEYDIKRGWFKNIEGDLLEKMMADVFGNVEKEGDLLVSTYGVLDRIEVKVLDKDKLDIVTVNKEGCASDDEAILDSKRRLNEFAERATGFDAKARMKRAQKKAKEGKLRGPFPALTKLFRFLSYLIIGQGIGLNTTPLYTRLDWTN